tara:strand:+ start:425 stop:1567 length:1143 start_codon:yes stop_codon:yes gene_type:complete
MAKKAPKKKVTAKKAPAKKAVKKKAPAKKAVKPPAKKAAPKKKAPTKKAAPKKKAPAKKAAPKKKAPAKKAAPKKKAPAKKAAPKKKAPKKKAPAKKAPAKKAPAKKAAPKKKAPAKKAAPKKKAPAKKAPAKKTVKKKTPVKKAAPAKKAVPKKKTPTKKAAPAKKAPAKKAVKKATPAKKAAKKVAIKKAPPKKRVVVKKRPDFSHLTQPLGPIAPAAASKNGGKPQKLSATFLKKQRQKLLDLRDALVDQMNGVARDSLGRGEEGGDSSAFGMHQADAGSDSYDRDFALSILSQEQDALHEIEEALLRIDSSEYGVCEGSGVGIPPARLEAMPFARCTVDFQERLDNENANGGFRNPATSLFGLDEKEVAKAAEDDE